MQKQRELQARRIAGLDGLRGIAVLAVVLYHMFPDMVKGGFLGVSVFFVLSGYLLAVGSRNEVRNDRFTVWDFYKKKLIRIYPALILTVCLTTIFLGIYADFSSDNAVKENISIFFGYNNWWQISQNASYFTKVNGTSAFIHLWSLAVEMQYYLLWPLLFIAFSRINKTDRGKRGAIFFVAAACLSLIAGAVLYRPGEDPTRVYYGTDTRAYSLLLGSALGFMKRPARVKKMDCKRYFYFFCIGIAVILFLFLYADGQKPVTYWLFLPLSVFLSAGIIYLSAIPGLPFGRWLDAAPLVRLGKYSYEIYLCQYPVSFLMKACNKGSYTVMQIALEVSAVILISVILHYCTLKSKVWVKQRKVAYMLCLTAVLSCGMVFGLLSGSGKGTEDKKRLQEELQVNAGLLEAQREEFTGQEKQVTYTAIGDSVMLGAAGEIQQAIPDCFVDAAESRQIWDAKAVAEELKEQGKLGDCVIIGLGANGSFDESGGQKLLEAIGTEKKIYWITAYGKYLTWQESVNGMIERLADKNDNLFIIDWAGVAEGHPEWFYEDGMHLNDEGKEAYADFLVQNVSG